MLLPVARLFSFIPRGLCLCAALVIGLIVLVVTPSATAQELQTIEKVDFVNPPNGMVTFEPTIDERMCSLPHQIAYNTGQSMTRMNELAKNEQFMRYSVSASYAANCINQFIDYFRKLDKAASKILTLASSTSLISAAITLLALEIIDSVVNQIIDAINNQVCNITNEIMGAIDSVVKNAICLPKLGGIGNFGFDVKLDLGRTQCNGWAINPAGIFKEAGVPVDDGMGGTAFEAPIIAGAPIRGVGGISYSTSLPPSFRNNLPDGDDGFYDYTEGEDIGQINEDTGTGSAGGNSKLNIAAAIAALNRNALSKSIGYCAMYVRYALEAGGLNTIGHPGSAKYYGPFLESRGFNQVSLNGYVPQAGDIAVMPPYPGGSPHGHIAMFDGSKWISDFVQRDMFGGKGYRANGLVSIYRP